MSAETLRRAAAEIRRDYPDPADNPDKFMHVVAYWLDVTARDVGTSSTAYHAALVVARNYLGEAL